MSSLCNTLMSRFLVVSMFIALALLVYLVTSSLVDWLASLLPNFTSLTYQQVRRWDEPGAFVLSLIVTALLMRWNNYATLARYRRASTLTPLLLFLLSHLGPLSGAYIIVIAWRSGPGAFSGLFLLPSMLWSLILYPISFLVTVWVLYRGDLINEK